MSASAPQRGGERGQRDGQRRDGRGGRANRRDNAAEKNPDVGRGVANVPGERWGSMLVGGHFLAGFIPDGQSWVHLDIAGPAWNPAGPRDYTPKGGTGAGVRTILATLTDLAAG